MSELEITSQKVLQNAEDIKCLKTDMKELIEKVGSKVPWKTFWIIVSILIAIVGGMWSALYNEIKSLQSTSTVTSVDVSYIKGVLNNAEINEN